jgi:15-cis-phytoene synthase
MSTAVQQAQSQFTPTHSQLAMAYSVCSGIARTNARNFYYAFLVLPHPKRNALCAIYAYMRRCDDLSDDATLPLRERRAKLEAWLDSFHRAQAGEPTDDAILLALTDTQRRYQIPAELLDQLAFGTLMDVPEGEEPTEQAAASEQELVIQYRTFKDLYLYCYHVASVVGLVCIKIFGYRDPNAEHLAERCGIAFQLTNIIRDVGEDARKNRIYLPMDELKKFEVPAADILQAKYSANFRSLMAFQAQRADAYYQKAFDALPTEDRRTQRAGLIMAAIYRATLAEIEQEEFKVLTQRTSLTPLRKLWLAWKTWISA